MTEKELFNEVNVILFKCDIGTEVKQCDFKPECTDCMYLTTSTNIYRCFTPLCPVRKLTVENLAKLANIIDYARHAI